jgi:hypothetical protein
VTVLLLASIGNTGAPSMANCCALRITTVDGATLWGKGIVVTADFTLRDSATGDPVRVFDLGDVLYAKLLRKQLKKGDLVRGFLFFVVEGITELNASRPGTQYVLELQDAFGGVHELSYTWTAQSPPKGLYVPVR